MKELIIDIGENHLRVKNIHFDFVNRIKASLCLLFTGYINFHSNAKTNINWLKEQEKKL